MRDADSRPRTSMPGWLAMVMVLLLAMQLVLTWIQGALLHRQHSELMGLREDVQVLTEAVEEGLWPEEDLEGSMAPARHRSRPRVRRPALQRVSLLQQAPAEEEEPALQDLRESRESAQEAVKSAGKVRSQLSIEENIRKADEKKAVESASGSWRTWLLVALGIGLLAVGIGAWLRRRE